MGPLVKRTKIYGFVDDWPYVRLFVDDREYQAVLKEGVWPEGIEPRPGQLFTLHMRGQKLLYCYPITKPPWTRSQLKKARKEARRLWEFFNSVKS